MPIYNETPRPRVLFEKVPEPLVSDLKRMVPTSKFVEWREKVHESNYDLLVSFADDASSRSSAMHVLAFGSRHGGYIGYRQGTYTQQHAIERDHTTRATLISIPDSIDSELRSLLERTVLPNILGSPVTEIWSHRGNYQGSLQKICRPLVHLGTEKYVAALERDVPFSTGESSLFLALPPTVTGHLEWVRYMLERLSLIDPTRFPANAEWKNDEPWSTPEVHSANARVRELEQERDSIAKRLDSEIREQGALAALKADEAESGILRVLTSDGDDLVESLEALLTDLGFSVANMDDIHYKNIGRRLEDLRITSQEDPDWTCLVEVKGYKKGVKTSEIGLIAGRPTANFVRETGEDPKTIWFVANAWRERPPSERPDLLTSPLTDLLPIEQYDGAAFDTRDLYRAWRAVQLEEVNLVDVHNSILKARGWWTWSGSGE